MKWYLQAGQRGHQGAQNNIGMTAFFRKDYSIEEQVETRKAETEKKERKLCPPISHCKKYSLN